MLFTRDSAFFWAEKKRHISFLWSFLLPAKMFCPFGLGLWERKNAGNFTTPPPSRKCLKDPWFIFDGVLVVRVPSWCWCFLHLRPKKAQVFLEIRSKKTTEGQSSWKTRRPILFIFSQHPKFQAKFIKIQGESDTNRRETMK